MRPRPILGAPLGLALLLAGCFGPPQKEVQEALNLARLLYRIAPEAQALSAQERKVAHEVRLMLDEGDVEKYRVRYQAALAQIETIRDRRIALQTQVRQGIATTPLVDAVQKDAMEFLEEDISRDSGWLQLAANLRLRKELGRTQNFPEVEILKTQLELFSGELEEPALTGQIQTLAIEYGFSDEVISQ